MLFCFGLGYTALHYLQQARSERACGTVRESAVVSDLPGLRTMLFDPENPELHSLLQKATEILVSIPPDENGDPVLRLFGGALPRARA